VGEQRREGGVTLILVRVVEGVFPLLGIEDRVQGTEYKVQVSEFRSTVYRVRGKLAISNESLSKLVYMPCLITLFANRVPCSLLLVP
jgi:hypothetical protein